MAPPSQSQWDTWLYLLKSEEMLRHLEMERQNRGASSSATLALCRWLIANGKVRRREGQAGTFWEEIWFIRWSWEKCQGLRSMGLHSASSWVLLFPSKSSRHLCYQLWGQSGQEQVHPTKGAFPDREEPPVPQGKLPMYSTVSGTSFVANMPGHQKVAKARGDRAAPLSCLPA